MKMGLNQPIMPELIEKLMESTDSDGLTESVKEKELKNSRLCEVDLSEEPGKD